MYKLTYLGYNADTKTCTKIKKAEVSAHSDAGAIRKSENLMADECFITGDSFEGKLEKNERLIKEWGYDLIGKFYGS